MRIAITADPSVPVPPRLYGGIERVIDFLVHRLSERGHDVVLFAHADSNVDVDHIPYPGTESRDLSDLIWNTLTVSQLLVSRPDVVHSFGRLAYLVALMPTRIPKIMSYQREPTIRRVQQAARFSRAGSLTFTGCSEHIAAKTRPYAPSYRVFNGVPIDVYDFQSSVADDAPLVFLGRIEPIKGTHHAVRVAHETSRPLVIAGNVTDTEEAQSYFKREIEPHVDGSDVRYVGPVDDTQKNDLLGRAAAFLMPIEWDEPFGIVMAEAMACGTPVVGFRRGSVPEVVRHKETGFICDTVDEMIDAVGRIDAIDRSACRRRCERLFSDRAVVDAYESLYRTVV